MAKRKPKIQDPSTEEEANVFSLTESVPTGACNESDDNPRVAKNEEKQERTPVSPKPASAEDSQPPSKLYLKFRILLRKYKLYSRRLNALRAIAALQFVPFVSSSLSSYPSELCNDIFGLFVCLAVLHLSKCSSFLQKKLKAPFLEFLENLAAVLKITPAMKHTLLKPFVFREQFEIANWSEPLAYGKPFADSITNYCTKQKEMVDESFYVNRESFINRYYLNRLKNRVDTSLVAEVGRSTEGADKPKNEGGVSNDTLQEPKSYAFDVAEFERNFELAADPSKRIVDDTDTLSFEFVLQGTGALLKEEAATDDSDYRFNFNEYKTKNKERMKKHENRRIMSGVQSFRKEDHLEFDTRTSFLSGASIGATVHEGEKKVVAGDASTTNLNSVTSEEACILLSPDAVPHMSDPSAKGEPTLETKESMEQKDSGLRVLSDGVSAKVYVPSASSSAANRDESANITKSKLIDRCKLLQQRIKRCKFFMEKYESSLLFIEESKVGNGDQNGKESSKIDEDCTVVLANNPPSPCVVLLRNIVGTYLLKNSFNARIHALFKSFSAGIGVNSEILSCMEEFLVVDLAVALKANKKKKSRDALRIAAAAAGGGALIAATAGLATPAVVAGLTTLGIGSIGATAFFGSVGGIALIASLFGASGAGLAGWKFSRRVSEIKVFEFERLRGEPVKSLHLRICVSGCLRNMEDILEPWKKAILSKNSDVYALKWEPQLLQKVLYFVGADLTKNLAMQAGQLGLKYTAAAVVSSALVAPITAVKFAANLDNLWMTLKERTKQAGEILADAITNKKTVGQRPVTLIGYSLGARLIFYCLLKLYNTHELNLVHDVVLMGMPSSLKVEKWQKAREVVSGRLINVYFGSDWLMAFLYRYMEWGVKVAALGPVEGVEGVDSYDVSGLVKNHSQYADKLGDIFSLIGLEVF